jgi:predicted HNH restriction endonuclease
MPSYYSAKLRDPRWLSVREEILARKGRACSRCGSGERVLHVHHRYYIANREPWDYPAGALVPVCNDCHALIHESPREIMEAWELLIHALDKHPSLIRKLALRYLNNEEKFFADMEAATV